MKLTSRSVAELLAAFQSSDPTPGGGSASALTAAVGASLLTMVAGLPKGRAATETDRARLERARALCADIAEHLTNLVDADSDAYQQVMSAYRQPKSTDDEKSARSAAIQAALKVATATPLKVMGECATALEHAVVVASFANLSAASDVLVGLELLQAGLRGAKLNVEINLGSVKDESYVRRIHDELAEIERAGLRRLETARTQLAAGSSA
jgi:formiminotetrahydrofolate cyclodeaminase